MANPERIQSNGITDNQQMGLIGVSALVGGASVAAVVPLAERTPWLVETRDQMWDYAELGEQHRQVEGTLASLRASVTGPMPTDLGTAISVLERESTELSAAIAEHPYANNGDLIMISSMAGMLLVPALVGYGAYQAGKVWLRRSNTRKSANGSTTQPA